jgi:predicted ATPase
MKTTQYFDHMRKRQDRAKIKDEWIDRVIQSPVKTDVQSDGRIRKWAWIVEEEKFLRVILLEDGETVHNAFFDRSFKEKQG